MYNFKKSVAAMVLSGVVQIYREQSRLASSRLQNLRCETIAAIIYSIESEIRDQALEIWLLLYLFGTVHTVSISRAYYSVVNMRMSRIGGKDQMWLFCKFNSNSPTYIPMYARILITKLCVTLIITYPI